MNSVKSPKKPNKVQKHGKTRQLWATRHNEENTAIDKNTEKFRQG